MIELENRWICATRKHKVKKKNFLKKPFIVYYQNILALFWTSWWWANMKIAQAIVKAVVSCPPINQT